MSAQTKNKFLIGLIILLVIANAITIGMFWLGRTKQKPLPQGGPKAFLVKELKLDEKQQAQYELLIKEHRQGSDSLREKIKTSKEILFNLLKNPVVADSIKSSAINEAARYTEQLDLLTFTHFQKVRALCTPAQQEKFDEILSEVIRMISQPRMPGPPDGRPPQHDGPPGRGEPPMEPEK